MVIRVIRFIRVIRLLGLLGLLGCHCAAILSLCGYLESSYWYFLILVVPAGLKIAPEPFAVEQVCGISSLGYDHVNILGKPR